MICSRRPPAGRRPGAVLVKCALLLPVLLAVLALALDGGMLFDNRRQAQAAADVVALSAAGEIFETYTDYTLTNDGLDDGTIASRAIATAERNGFPNDGVDGTVVVNIPPQSGNYAGQLGYVEVILSRDQQRAFATVFGSGDLPVVARAVARGRWAPVGIGILCLDPTGSASLNISGGAQGIVPNSAVIVNSTDDSAAYAQGTGTSLLAKKFEITGGVTQNSSGGQFIGPIDLDEPPTPDPYRQLPEPDPTIMPARSLQKATVVDNGNGYKTYYLEPGVYDRGLAFSGKATVIMAPGVYYMNGGGFKFSGGSDVSLTAEGVMLFNDSGRTGGNDPASNAISITGQASVTWTPPTSGLYRGMSFYQKRDQSMPINISGQGNMRITGSYYARDADINVSGSGTNYIGTQFVCWNMNLSGNGDYIVPWDAGTIQPVRDLKLVE